MEVFLNDPAKAEITGIFKGGGPETDPKRTRNGAKTEPNRSQTGAKHSQNGPKSSFSGWDGQGVCRGAGGGGVVRDKENH